MRKLSWLITFIGGFFAIGGLVEAFYANSSPQQAATAAVAMALVVIPYCMARSVSELGGSVSEQLKVLNETAQVQSKLLAALANRSENAQAKTEKGVTS